MQVVNDADHAKNVSKLNLLNIKERTEHPDKRGI